MKAKNKAWIQNHMRYAGWRYALMIAAAIFGWSIIFTVTAYRVPPERKVDVYFVGPYSDGEKLRVLQQDIQADLKGIPNIEEVNVLNVVLEGDTSGYAIQALQVRLGAGEGDIYLMPRSMAIDLAEGDLFLPLDEMLADGRLKVTSAVDLSGGTLTVVDGEYPGEHVYAIPLAEYNGFIENELYDSTNVFIGITSFSRNPDGAARVLQWLLDHREGPPPEWWNDAVQEPETSTSP